MDPTPTARSMVEDVKGLVALYKVWVGDYLTMGAVRLDLSMDSLWGPLYIVIVVRFDKKGLPVQLPDRLQEWAYRHQDSVGIRLAPLMWLNSLIDCQVTMLERTRERALLKLDSLMDEVEPTWRAHTPEVTYYPEGTEEGELAVRASQDSLREGGEDGGGGVGGKAPPPQKPRISHPTQNSEGVGQ